VLMNIIHLFIIGSCTRRDMTKRCPPDNRCHSNADPPAAKRIKGTLPLNENECSPE
jgi:hypothetical protein